MKIVTLDVGGTAIKYGMYVDGVFLDVKERDTNAKLGGEHLFQTICDIVSEYEGFDYIAISTAGQVNPIEGYIIFSSENIPEYTGMQLKKRLQKSYGVEVFVENDVNAMALGEAYFGAGKDEKDFLCLTYGTGIGGAIVMNRGIYYGSAFSAGEFGSMITHGSVRKVSKGYLDGAYEKYASTTALIKKASQLNPKYTNGRAIFEDIHTKEIQDIVDTWIDEIMIGLVNLTHMFNPPCIILGGGVMAQPYVIGEIKERMLNEVMPNYRHVKVLNASLANQAGMYGAVARVLQDKQ